MTQPPGDPWQPPPANTSQMAPTKQAARPVDAWGQPLTDFDPAANRTVLERSAARLTTWLGVLLAVLALSGVASALGLYFGGWGLLRLVSSAMTLLNPGPLPAATGWLLGLAALLVLALTGIYLGAVNWARELIGRLGRWAALAPQQAIPSPAPDAVRIEQLRRTLAGWLRFGQWGTLLGALLSLGITLVVSFYADQWTRGLGGSSLGGGTLGGSDTTPLGPGFLAVQTVSSLVSSVPGVVVTWLILGATERFMNLAVQRARGLATGPLTQTAKTVNNWFLMCLILLGLTALNVVIVCFGLALALTLLPELSTSLAGYGTILGAGFLSDFRSWGASVLVGVAVYSLLTVALYFALLIFSRSYALSLARTLDLPTKPHPTPLPTGSAGENPNIFRGQL